MKQVSFAALVDHFRDGQVTSPRSRSRQILNHDLPVSWRKTISIGIETEREILNSKTQTEEHKAILVNSYVQSRRETVKTGECQSDLVVSASSIKKIDREELQNKVVDSSNMDNIQRLSLEQSLMT